MTEPTPAVGEFWSADRSTNRARGQFMDLFDRGAVAHLECNLIPDPRVSVFTNADGRETGYAVSGDPARSVEAFLAVTLHGTLDSGEAVTLLHAQNYGRAGWPPEYRAAVAVHGDHIAENQLFTAVRFRMDHPAWLAHLSEGQACRVGDDGPTLTVQASEDCDNWLVYESSKPVTLRQIEIRVVSGCVALLQLALYSDEDRTIHETQVRIEPTSPWLAVHGTGFCAERGSREHETLLPARQLTIERYATWITLHTKLDGLTWVVARPFNGAVQTRVLLLTTLIEGFHRAMDDYQQAKFPDADSPALRRIGAAARTAAKVQAREEAIDEHAVDRAVTFHTEVSYRERAQAIIDEIRSAVPEVVESILDPAGRIVKARNNLAHQLNEHDDSSFETRVLEWLVVANTLSWLLRCFLLLRAGIEPDVLRERLRLFQQFGFFRANNAQHVRELGWQLPN